MAPAGVARHPRLLLGGLGAAVLIVAGSVSAVTGHDPFRLLATAWHNIRGDSTTTTTTVKSTAPSRTATATGRLVGVGSVVATVQPAKRHIHGYSPGNAVDGNPKSAWGTTWGGSTAPVPDPPCRQAIPRTTAAVLRLTLNGEVTVDAVVVAAGLPATDRNRLRQWQPVKLRLVFSDKTCQYVSLAGTPTPQRVLLHPVRTAEILVQVVAAVPPHNPGTMVALAEVDFLTRS